MWSDGDLSARRVSPCSVVPYHVGRDEYVGARYCFKMWLWGLPAVRLVERFERKMRRRKLRLPQIRVLLGTVHFGTVHETTT